MNLLEPFVQLTSASPSRIYGVVMAIVTSNKDPDGAGRVRVRFPWLTDADASAWARVATPMAGNNRGLFLLPEVEDEVLVAFEQGDPAFPYVIGSLWNGKDKPPADNADGKNDVRMLRSRSGHVVRLVDTDGKEKIEIVDKSGKNKIVIDSASNAVSIVSDGKITLDGQDVEIKAKSGVKITGQSIDLN